MRGVMDIDRALLKTPLSGGNFCKLKAISYLKLQLIITLRYVHNTFLLYFNFHTLSQLLCDENF